MTTLKTAADDLVVLLMLEGWLAAFENAGVSYASNTPAEHVGCRGPQACLMPEAHMWGR